ncbi:hypothetical protein GP2_005_00120 [Gordonia paraffinivorans NBRC 108238]|uniref:Uncharacterized protein n=1 Tax=Gordonia paraffinivorans NBRC 108238 TaxID=1223543 RepID=A0ABQ0IGR4_9ACTN|nr:hypothetical protein GP2_005_00120 [Gordonia paraffinivorans NBRC 108238]
MGRLDAEVLRADRPYTGDPAGDRAEAFHLLRRERDVYRGRRRRDGGSPDRRLRPVSRFRNEAADDECRCPGMGFVSPGLRVSGPPGIGCPAYTSGGDVAAA